MLNSGNAQPDSDSHFSSINDDPLNMSGGGDEDNLASGDIPSAVEPEYSITTINTENYIGPERRKSDRRSIDIPIDHVDRRVHEQRRTLAASILEATELGLDAIPIHDDLGKSALENKYLED